MLSILYNIFSALSTPNLNILQVFYYLCTTFIVSKLESSKIYENAFWLYEEEPISFILQTFKEREENFKSETITGLFQKAYESGNKVIVRQFGLSSSEIWDQWNSIYTDKQIIVITYQGSDLVYAIQLHEPNDNTITINTRTPSDKNGNHGGEFILILCGIGVLIILTISVIFISKKM